jgi:hypothetical protein
MKKITPKIRERMRRFISKRVQMLYLEDKTIKDIIKEFEFILLKIPEEYRDSAYIIEDHHYGPGDGGECPEFYIEYKVPESDESLDARIEEMRKAHEDQKQNQYEQYLKLKEKFEKKNDRRKGTVSGL